MLFLAKTQTFMLHRPFPRSVCFVWAPGGGLNVRTLSKKHSYTESGERYLSTFNSGFFIYWCSLTAPGWWDHKDISVLHYNCALFVHMAVGPCCGGVHAPHYCAPTSANTSHHLCVDAKHPAGTSQTGANEHVPFTCWQRAEQSNPVWCDPVVCSSDWPWLIPSWWVFNNADLLMYSNTTWAEIVFEGYSWGFPSFSPWFFPYNMKEMCLYHSMQDALDFNSES